MRICQKRVLKQIAKEKERHTERCDSIDPWEDIIWYDGKAKCRYMFNPYYAIKVKLSNSEEEINRIIEEKLIPTLCKNCTRKW